MNESFKNLLKLHAKMIRAHDSPNDIPSEEYLAAHLEYDRALEKFQSYLEALERLARAANATALGL